MKINELPDDINALKKMIFDLSAEVQQLKENLLLAFRKKYAPTSEQCKDEPQLMLFNELEESIVKDAEVTDSGDEEDEIEVGEHMRKRGKRSPIPEELPRVEVIYDLGEHEKIGMKLIGEERSEKLDIIPAKIFVSVIVRKKYAKIYANNMIDDNDNDEKSGIKVAPAPKELLPKTLASAGLIAYIVAAKYVDSIPLYRQEKIFSRFYANLKRQTMARWLISVSQQMIPLYNLLQDLCLDSSYLQMDETVTQVLKEDGKKATSKSYMWVRYLPGDRPIILYDYAPSRSGSVPIELLEGFKGILQVDGYDGYAKVCEQNKLIRAGCWDHCRRKFFDASKSSKGKGIGSKVINLLKKVYKLEEQIKSSPLEIKLEIRQAEIKPILAEIKSYVDDLRRKTTPDSSAGKAINYCFNEWKYLTVFLDHPEVNISNSMVENSIRPFAVGRKNWLFSDSVDGAKASALFYSFVETAKANGLEPFDYFSKMLDKLPSATMLEDYQRLLPLKNYFLK